MIGQSGQLDASASSWSSSDHRSRLLFMDKVHNHVVMMTVASYTRQQVVAMTGVPSETLSFWLKRNIVWGLEPSTETRRWHRFDRWQVALVAILTEARRWGISLNELGEIAKIIFDALTIGEKVGDAGGWYYEWRGREPDEARARLSALAERLPGQADAISNALSCLERFEALPGDPAEHHRLYELYITLAEAISGPQQKSEVVMLYRLPSGDMTFMLAPMLENGIQGDRPSGLALDLKHVVSAIWIKAE